MPTTEDRKEQKTQRHSLRLRHHQTGHKSFGGYVGSKTRELK